MSYARANATMSTSNMLVRKRAKSVSVATATALTCMENVVAVNATTSAPATPKTIAEAISDHLSTLQVINAVVGNIMLGHLDLTDNNLRLDERTTELDNPLHVSTCGCGGGWAVAGADA